MLGNKLYPLVEQIEPVQARKVTGMLLEMGKLEILHLLESQEALQAKVLEAVVVLQRSEARGSPNPASSAVSTPTMDAWEIDELGLTIKKLLHRILGNSSALCPCSEELCIAIYRLLILMVGMSFFWNLAFFTLVFIYFSLLWLAPYFIVKLTCSFSPYCLFLLYKLDCWYSIPPICAVPPANQNG